MLESYAVGVKFELVSNVATVLGQAIESVEKFEKIMTAATERTAALNKELRGLSGAARGIRGLADAMRALESANPAAAATAGVDRLEGRYRTSAS